MARASQSGLGLGVGLGRQLGADGAVLVVEAQEAPLVLRARPERAKRLWASSAGRTGDVGQLDAPSTPWPGRTARARSRAWPRRPAPAPCRRRALPHEQRPDQLRDVPRLLAHMGVGPGRRCRDPEALGGPGLEGGRPLVSNRPGAARLAQADEESRLGRRSSWRKSSIETGRQLLVRLGRHRTDEIGADGVGEGLRHRGKNGRARRDGARRSGRSTQSEGQPPSAPSPSVWDPPTNTVGVPAPSECQDP